MQVKESRTDIAILGGGIAGLWLLNLLSDRGFDCVLLEKHALGGHQTLASQGMIHGGIKYALDGFLNDASETIAAMPDRWAACLDGNGSLDLSGVRTLSRDYFLFSDGGFLSKATAFLGSKAVEGRVEPVSADEVPPALKHDEFRGLTYRLQDIVLDTGSLVSHLAGHQAGRIYTGDFLIESGAGQINALVLPGGDRIEARRFILAAGKGNGEIIEQLSLPVAMQLRPLNQVVVTGDLPELFAHAVSLKGGRKPRLTITTHQSGSGSVNWYIGGQLAESGVDRTDAAQIEFARSELAVIFPWMSFENCEFRTLRIDRAEVSEKDRRRPDTPYAKKFSSSIVCWPTKLTLVPMLGDKVEALLDTAPGNTTPFPGFSGEPVIASAPWETRK